MATATIEELVGKRFDELGQSFQGMTDDLKKTLDTLQAPQYHTLRDGGGYAEWSAETDYDPTPQVVRRGDPDFALKVPRLPKSYKPYSVWKNAGDFYKAVINDNAKGSLDFTESMKKAIQGMNTQVGSEGAFTVLPEFNKTILEKVYQNNLWSMCDGYQCAGNNLTFLRNAETSRVNGSRHGGLRGYWLGEGGALTASKPGLATLQLKLNKLGVVVYLTDELIEDTGIALEQYVNRKVSDEFSFLLGDAVVEGDGVSKPQGFQNSKAVVSVAKLAQGAKTILTENIDQMWARFFAGSVPTSAWLVNQDTWPQLLGLVRVVGTGGVPVFVPPGGASAAPYGTLMGRPVIPIEFAATLGTVGDINLVDLSQYVTLNKGGIAQAESMHVEFLTDQRALRFIMRVDGATWEASPVTPFKGSNTQSSFITLATRA